MNRKLLLIFSFVLFLALLTGCRGSKDKLSKSGPTATPIPNPNTDKATVTGKIFSTSANKPYPKAPVWLAEVYRSGDNGAYVLDHAFSPASFADDNGAFVISNVDPKEYVIVVGDPDNVYVVIPDDTGRARVWKTEAGKILDVGTLNVSLVPATPSTASTPTPASAYPSPQTKSPASNPYP